VKPVTQTKFPQRGNCFAACVATILEVDIIEVPAFEEVSLNPFIPAKRWLHEHGFDFHHSTAEYPPPGYAIAVGESPRNPDIQHAVVTLAGQVVHDPHPDGQGLTMISRYFAIVKNA
jgi:hypothetical protein